MLGIFNKVDELDWTQDPLVVEAQRARTEAKARVDATYAEAQRLWAEENFSGSNPPPDARYWTAKRAWTDALAGQAEAIAVTQAAEREAQAAARSGWIARYVHEWAAVESATDELIARLSDLTRSFERAEELGIKLVWAACGEMSVASLEKWRSDNRAFVEQLK